MHIVIFGATGTVGQQLVVQALALGHDVTAFVRNKAKLSHVQHGKLKLAVGDVLDYPSVGRAVRGQDAVLCALGAGRKGVVRSSGTSNILDAMEYTGVKRFICQSTLGAGDSRANLSFFWKHIMFGFLLREAYRDHQLQESFVMASKTDWTIVRPAALTNGPLTGKFRHGFSPNVRKLALKISRADVAMFMLKQLDTHEYLHKTPGLSY